MRSAGYYVCNNKHRHRIVTINFGLHYMAYFLKMACFIIYHISIWSLCDEVEDLPYKQEACMARIILQVELMTDLDYINCNGKFPD